jgi:hypothetical protein
MQIRKAGVVAVGALATVAAMGSAAAATPLAHSAGGDPSANLLTQTGSRAATSAAMKQLFANSDTAQPLITLFRGSSVMALPWQVCGSTATAGVGGTGAVSSPNTLMGDCTNGRVLLKQDNVPGLISLFDDSSVNLVPWQVCGSTVVAGVGATAALNSPSTVDGDCVNAKTKILAPDGEGPRSLLSLFSGSSLDVLAWQVCGSTAVMGVGVAAGFNSPTTVTGKCSDANATIQKREPNAILPILSNVGLDILPLQVCASDSLTSLVGLSPALNSPANVFGGCEAPDGAFTG